MNQRLISLILLAFLLSACTAPNPEHSPDAQDSPAVPTELHAEGMGNLAQISWVHEDNASIEYDLTVRWSWPELERGQLRAAAMFFELPGKDTWYRVANKPILVSAVDDLGGVSVGASVFGVGASRFVDEPTGAASGSAPTNTLSTSGPLAFDDARWKLQGMEPTYPVKVHFVVFGSTASELGVDVEFDRPMNASIAVFDDANSIVVYPNDVQGQASIQAGAFVANDSHWSGAPVSGERAVWAARWPVLDGEGQDVRVKDPVNPVVDLDHYLGWVGYSPIAGDWVLDIVAGTSESQFDQPFLLIMPMPDEAA